MTFEISIVPSGKQFQADEKTNVLDAAIGAGIVLPYGCKNGACGSCKARIVSGEVVQHAHQPSALTSQEVAQGMALLCCASPRSDLTVEARVVEAVGDIAVRRMPCRVRAIDRVAPDVVRVELQLPATERFQYLAGQYIDLLLRDGSRRSYSMARAPSGADSVELHIRHLPGGRFTDALFGASTPEVKVRDILRLEGPLGTFFLREDNEKPIVLLASGTGFAPIKAIVEQIIAKGIRRPVTLYWGGRRPVDLYDDALARQWEEQLPAFRYVPVVSDARDEDGWTGRTGFVHRAVLDDFSDLSGVQVYACGAPIVVDSARRDFVGQRGLPAEEFHADAFTNASDLANATGDQAIAGDGQAGTA